MKISIDFETKSELDIYTSGIHKYIEHESTDVYCAAFKIDHWETYLWINPKYHNLYNKSISTKEFIMFMEQADTIHAYVAEFERLIWNEILYTKYNFPKIPLHKWRCTAAKAATYALPRSLENVCEVLNLPQKKDIIGKKIMMKWCKPRKSTKNNLDIWHNDKDEFKRLCEYCMQDVEAETCIDNFLPNISSLPLNYIWFLDQKINDTGFYIDLQSAKILIEKVQKKEIELLLEIQQITKGFINSVRQIEKTKLWLKNNGVNLQDLTKQTVENILKADIPEKCKRLLLIRQTLGKSSVAKLMTLQNTVCKDNRIRGALMYHGASTGRWSGKFIQPQNLPRNSFDEVIFDNVLYHNSDKIIDILYENIILAASKCLRGLIQAAPNHQLYCADYNAIEARILAWVTNETEILEIFYNNEDPYINAASVIYNKPQELITMKERFIGKTVILACGYQGWIGAFRQIANKEINKLSDDKIAEIISAWRKANPNIVNFWKEIENTVIKTIKTSEIQQYNGIKFNIENNFLVCRLPSNRPIFYYEPEIQKIETPYGMKEAICFKAVNSITKKWTLTNTYGGKLTENIVQALARDILVHALLKLNEKGFKIVLHIHDEILIEHKKLDEKKTKETLDNIINIMETQPDWAVRLPLKVAGWTGNRYRK